MTAEDVVFLRDGYKSRVARVGDIVTIDAATNDMVVKLASDDEVTIRGPLNRCLEKLPANLFFKASRSCAVNLSHVDKVNAAQRSIQLTMRDGREIMMSRKQSILFGKQFVL